MTEDVLGIFLLAEIDLTKILKDLNNNCVNILYDKYMIIHTPSSNILQSELIEQFYRATLKCYGLMDTYNLEETGVTRLRRQLGYDLYGSGVLIRFVDTGERVIIMLS